MKKYSITKFRKIGFALLGLLFVPGCQNEVSDLRDIYPLTDNQETFFNLYAKGHQALLVHGVAGTGKTYIAMFNAFHEILQANSPYKKVVIVRSAVPSRDIGFLPGNEKEKVEVYSQPYQEICAELFPRFADRAYNKLKEQNLITFMVACPVYFSIQYVNAFPNNQLGEHF